LATTPLLEEVSGLLSLPLVAERSGGAPDSQLESAAISDLISMALSRNPRSVLYLVHLARNSLIVKTVDLTSVIDDMISATKDLSNPVFALRDSTGLEEIRSVLLNMEAAGSVKADDYLFKRLRGSVSRVLNKDLGKAVRRGGKFSRPADEALLDLSASLKSLAALYGEVSEQAAALPVAEKNFSSFPLHQKKALSAAVRFRASLEEVLAEMETDGSTQAGRSLAQSLIAGKSSVEHLSKTVSVTDPVLSTSALLPDGYSVAAETAKTAAEVTLSAGPYSLSAGTSITVSDASGSASAANFPQTTHAVGNLPFVVGSAVSWPVTVPSPGTPPETTPPETYQPALLFLVTTGSSTTVLPVNLNPGTYTLSALITAINAVPGLVAHEYVQAGTNRLRVSATSGSEIRVATAYSVRAQNNSLTTYISAHEKFGFSGTESGTAPLTAALAAEAMNICFGAYLTATPQVDGTIRLVGKKTNHGSRLTFVGPTAMGGTKEAYATSDEIRLFGKVFGTDTDPVSPVGVVSVGQVLTLGGSSSPIRGVTGTRVFLSDPIPTYSGDVLVEAPIVAAHQKLVELLSDLLVTWRASAFSAGLDEVERAVSSCVATRSPPQQGELVRLLTSLRNLMSDLKDRLTDAGTLFPAESTEAERTIAEGVLDTLRDRGMDRASDLLLRGRILEGCTLDGRSGSYSGDLELAMSSVARNEVTFPDRANDEGWKTAKFGLGDI